MYPDARSLTYCRDGESVTEVLDRDGCCSGVKPLVTFFKPPFPDDYPQNASRSIYLLGLV